MNKNEEKKRKCTYKTYLKRVLLQKLVVDSNFERDSSDVPASNFIFTQKCILISSISHLYNLFQCFLNKLYNFYTKIGIFKTNLHYLMRMTYDNFLFSSNLQDFFLKP